MELSQRKPEVPTRAATCEKHGSYESFNYFRDHWSGCSECAAEVRAAEEAAAHDRERKKRRAERLGRCGLVGRFEDARFENYAVTQAEQRAVLAACREFADTVQFDAGGGLWLVGPPGTGKTHLGSSIVRHIIEERDAEACIYSSREIIRMLRATWKGNGGSPGDGYDWSGMPNTEEGLIRHLGWVPLLVIDEIGVSFGTDAEAVQLFDIIDLRYKYRRPTVVLSNLQAAALKPAMGDRPYDRLREGAKLLTCAWPSHRGTPPASGARDVR